MNLSHKPLIRHYEFSLSARKCPRPDRENPHRRLLEGAARAAPLLFRFKARNYLTSFSARSAACTAGRAAMRSWKACSAGNAPRSSFTMRAQLVTTNR